MNEMKVDEIKRNDEMILLDKYFPGISCGNQNCEKKGGSFMQIFFQNAFNDKGRDSIAFTDKCCKNWH